MPDWSYRTLFRPVLFRLPPVTARNLCLGVMGRLARLPLGSAVIDFMGHMRPDPRLRQTRLGIDFPTAIGLGVGIDSEAMALKALARFGIGFLEVGPVTLEVAPGSGIERRFADQAIWLPEPMPNPGLAALLQRLSRLGKLPVPLIVRVGVGKNIGPERATDECRQIIEQLAPFADLVCLGTLRLAAAEGWNSDAWRSHLRAVYEAARQASPPRELLLAVPPDLDRADEWVAPALEVGIGGLVVESGIATGDGILLGLPACEPALAQVRRLRQRWGPTPLLIAGGGVHEPAQALQLRAAGADLVTLDSGLVYAGPGLPKRVNEAILYAAPEPPPAADRPAEMSWFWTLLLGLGMTLGGTLALIIAATRVVLPYDEAFVGLSRQEMAAINDRLLAFMAHDRVSLAGTMISIGVLYTLLSWFGVRHGLHWAKVAILSSAFAGFASFFFFLGFGYFDPFHAFVTAVLFQFLLLALHSRLAAPRRAPPPNLRDDWRWRWSLWGQLLFITQGAVLLGAGTVISAIGTTQVFVAEDLAFMQTTADALTAAHPRLLPLVAHDRASFGGMLIANGLAVLLPALWGYRQGQRWLWWTFLAAGTPAYAAGIGVHLVVGYNDLFHLTPAFAGAGVFAVALGLSYPYLCCRSEPAD